MSPTCRAPSGTPPRPGRRLREAGARGVPGREIGDPDVPVLAGSFAGTDPRFLRGSTGAGIREVTTGWLFHPYDDTGFKALKALRRLQLAHGDHARVWITEFGWPTGRDPKWHVSEATQAADLPRAYQDLSKLKFVRAAMMYDLRDEGTDPLNMEDNFGLVRRDFTRSRPSRRCRRSFAAGRCWAG